MRTSCRRCSTASRPSNDRIVSGPGTRRRSAWRDARRRDARRRDRCGARRQGRERSAQCFDVDRGASGGARSRWCARISAPHFRCDWRPRDPRCGACSWRIRSWRESWSICFARDSIRGLRRNRRVIPHTVDPTEQLKASYLEQLAEVENIADDRTARAVLSMVEATVRTNYFLPRRQPHSIHHAQIRERKNSRPAGHSRHCTRSTLTARAWRDAICAQAAWRAEEFASAIVPTISAPRF